ncbi:DNA-binding transcriptional regulator, LysR family [Streptomyces zhaozhouensis]|uniref:DNA-binding transcriptional regulator, LysR family n=1 Tax=Streptomyces zhaozhouensis TaxID=1300267 RepID=A0A286DXG3_9ACTN|nr:LysR family transcriptional regulator [Streptomyces zhaozhouensis]SOD63355.1 DNA-binding transcriptional regulator, LysR family [Streptomyces zhaozhouensis]
MLDVRRLQVLRAVVTSGSVTAAAQHLGYTPSAVSQQLGVLERQAGTRLLARVGRGVRPTAAGRLLAEHAELISRQLAVAETALAELRAGRSGSLTLRYFASAGGPVVAPALAAFRAAHPGVRVTLRLDDPGESLDEVARGAVDAALVVRDPGDRMPGVESRQVAQDPFRAVLPRGHRLAGREELALADLAGEPWVTGEWPVGPCLRRVLDACAAAGFSPDLAVESEDYPTAQGFVAAGLGVAVVPALALGTPHPGVVSRPLSQGPGRPVCLAAAEATWELPTLATLESALRGALREAGAVDAC